MRCNKTVNLVAIFLLIATRALCQSPDETAAQAAKAYNQKQYAASVEMYEKIIASGYESVALYYNAANAYFRNNQVASAILFYEKALKHAPNNEDIRHNLEVANSKLIDKVEQVPELFYKRWWKQLLNLMGINTMAATNIILLALALLLISIYLASSGLLLRKISFWAGCTLLFLFFLGAVAASQRNFYNKTHHEAIIFTPTVNVKSSPDENSKDIFVLHEGTKVSLRDEVGGWQEIYISNGSVGWLKASDFKEI